MDLIVIAFLAGVCAGIYLTIKYGGDPGTPA